MLIKVNNHTEAVRQISKILELLDKMIEKNNKKNIQYNFSMFIFNCLISEKILYLLSLIADKNELKKSKMLIFINLLDLSPIYNSRLRLFIIGDMSKFCNDSCLNLEKRLPKKDLIEIHSNELFYTMKLSNYKIRSIYHTSSEKKKNVILLFDLNFPILKDINFLEKFKKYFLKKSKHKNDFYISFFDEKLFIFSDLEIEDEKNNDYQIQKENKIQKFENSTHNNNYHNNGEDPLELMNRIKENAEDTISDRNKNI